MHLYKVDIRRLLDSVHHREAVVALLREGPAKTQRFIYIYTHNYTHTHLSLSLYIYIYIYIFI